MSDKRRFYLRLSSGEQFEISELDYNNIEHRVVTGRTNGWYVQRGKGFDRHGWKVAFKDIAGSWADKPEQTEKEIEEREKVIVTEKRKPEGPAGEKKNEPTAACHEWNDPETWDYITTMVNGRNHYRKECKECGKRSPLVKPAQVEREMNEAGKDGLNDVPLVE